MNSNLFKAILSMDAYNRGYNASIDLRPRDANGNLILVNGEPIESDKAGTAIGNATITAARGQNDAQNIGFYALAYSYNGAKIISYRGTDDVDGIPNPLTDLDVYHGWTLGAGNTASEQGRMAVQFYQAVAGTGIDPRTPNISLTGHSLGGGLAGQSLHMQ